MLTSHNICKKRIGDTSNNNNNGNTPSRIRISLVRPYNSVFKFGVNPPRPIVLKL